MCRKLGNILDKIRRRKRENKVKQIKGIMEDRNHFEKLSMLGYLLAQYTLEESIENKEADRMLTETIYNVLRTVFKPMHIATVIGEIGLLLLRDNPEMMNMLDQAQLQFDKRKDEDRIGLV